MRNIIPRVRRELRSTLQRPGRLARLMNPRMVLAHTRWLVSSGHDFEIGDWHADARAAGVDVRRYRTYDDYLQHQRAKLETLDLTSYDDAFYAHLSQRLAADTFRQGTTVLCLGARLGTEVRAFLSQGCFAVGIDLNPGEGNRYVLAGDFHALQFPDASVDVVFTNALDHALDIERILLEVTRVMKPDGMFIVEAVAGRAEGTRPGFYESFFWNTTDDLIGAIERSALSLTARSEFSVPWQGSHLRFQQRSCSARETVTGRDRRTPCVE